MTFTCKYLYFLARAGVLLYFLSGLSNLHALFDCHTQALKVHLLTEADKRD